MLHLRTLGGVSVTDDEGAALGAAATQRRLLAILSVLAVAGERGMSRDRLQSLLWPDGDPERTRHALSQSLYHARRILRCDDLFLPGADLRLDPQRIVSDVQLLGQALADGALARAAELYAGPLLHDFYVPGAGELDLWIDVNRRRIADAMLSVFDRLAAERESARDFTAALEWRRRQTMVDPLGGTTAMRMVEALIAAGDRPGALRHAVVYETLLRAELDTTPDPAFTDFVARVREGPAPQPLAVAEPPNPPEAAETGPTGVALTIGADRHARPRRIGLAAAKVRGTWLLLAAAAALLLAGGLFSRSGREGSQPVVPLNQAIVVAPFRTTGLDGSLGFLREGVVELLSMRVGEDSASRAIDPGAVLRAWQASRLLESADPPRADVIGLAHRLGAAHVVVGGIVGDQRRLLISSSLLSVPAGHVEASATVEGPADSLTSLLDQLTGRLLVLRAGEAERLGRRITPSLDALRAYLAGQSSYRVGRYSRAMISYERALRADSTFALAALQLALAADRVNLMEQHDRALAIAWENRRELHPRDRALLLAFAGPRYPSPSPEREQIAAWNAAVAAAPDRSDVWTELGERLFHAGSLLGVPDHRARAAAALRRALALNPSDAVARRLLVLLAAAAGDVTTLRSTAAAGALRDSMGGFGAFLEWRAGHALSDGRTLTRVRRQLPDLDDANLRAIGMSSLFDAVGADDGARALAIRADRLRRTSDRVDALLAQHSLSLIQGRPMAALRLTERLEEMQPGSRAHLRLRVLDALYGGGSDSAARAAIAALTTDRPEAPTLARREARLADRCVIGQWDLLRGHTAGIRDVISELRGAGLPRDLVLIAANPHTCAEILEATLAVATGSVDAPERVARLDSLMLGGPSAGDAAAYVHLVVARLYERIGQPRRALDAIRRRPYMTGWPRYLATTRREQGRLAATVGDSGGAILMYSRYLALRQAPEALMQPEVDSVRAVFAALSEAH
jgi:DNA-binding SARP family transcriptional activator/tetratricopeptide (TPR) repeat protein